MQSLETDSRTLYLIRHCNAGGDGRCISKANLPLDDFGAYQARRLAAWAAEKRLTAVYSSPLARAYSTAAAIAGSHPVISLEALREAGAGEWEGLTFEEIRKRYPEDYERRGEDAGAFAPTGGESLFDAGRRLLEALNEIIAATHGDIAVVSHGGAIRGAIAQLQSIAGSEILQIPQPRGGITELRILPDGNLEALSVGLMPFRIPDERELSWLRVRYKMPENVALHCNAVAKKSLELAKAVPDVDTKLLYAAAMLHDLSRTKGFLHASDGARLLRDSGYPELCDPVLYHHDLPDDASVETELLYLADKLMCGETEVSLHERFRLSRLKCKTGEAISAWQRRYDAAERVARRLNLEVLL